jgi:hypothetical protein
MKPIYFLLASVLLLNRPALAQTTPITYEFLTLAARESSVGTLSQITFAPAFQGKTQLQLEETPASFAKSVPAHQRNLVMVNQQLEALTAAGWELVQAFSTDSQGREYLFRRRKP